MLNQQYWDSHSKRKKFDLMATKRKRYRSFFYALDEFESFWPTRTSHLSNRRFDGLFDSLRWWWQCRGSSDTSYGSITHPTADTCGTNNARTTNYACDTSNACIAASHRSTATGRCVWAR